VTTLPTHLRDEGGALRQSGETRGQHIGGDESVDGLQQVFVEVPDLSGRSRVQNSGVFSIRSQNRKILSMGGSVKAEWDRGVELRPGTVARAIFMGWGVTTDQLTSLVIAVFLAPCGDVIVLGRNPMGRAEWRCVHRATWPNLTHDVQLNRPFTKLQLFPVPSAGQGSTPESLEDELHLLQSRPMVLVLVACPPPPR
jgi:hypothetical protein